MSDARQALLARMLRGEAKPKPEDADRDLMMRFESLGEDCELGFVQRRYGAEPLSLLRFISIDAQHLLLGLQDGFAEIATPAMLTVAHDPARAGEIVVFNARYQCGYSTIAATGQSLDALHMREVTKLRAMRPMLIRALERGDRICVVKARVPLDEQMLVQLHQAIQAYGSATLLQIVLADAAHPPGSVGWHVPGILIGHIDRFAPEPDLSQASAVWLDICRGAFELWQNR